MILMQIMIYNLARTKERIKIVITAFVASAALNGLVGAIQIGSYALWINGKLSQSAVLTTPYYRNLDAFIYDLLPFEISTNMWSSRASGFFSNPNLLATMMVVAFPLAIYLFLNASTKRTSVIYFSAITCIAAGMASTLTRAGSIIMLIEWAVLFVIHIKKNGKKLALSAIPTGICTVLALLTRYGKITVLTSANMQYWQNNQMLNGVEALQSSEAHFNIWRNIIDYISNHINTLIVGNGFGMEETGKILFSEYGLNKPHAHNFVGAWHCGLDFAVYRNCNHNRQASRNQLKQQAQNNADICGCDKFCGIFCIRLERLYFQLAEADNNDDDCYRLGSGDVICI